MIRTSFDGFGASAACASRARRLASGLALVFLAGCEQGAEGDRCNPDLSHDECNSGLTCQVVSDPITGDSCGESYCCPTPASESTNPNCNGIDDAPLPDGAPQCPAPAAREGGDVPEAGGAPD